MTTKINKEILHEKIVTAPDYFCGSCPAWLAYGDAPSVRTYPDLVKHCREVECPIVGHTQAELKNKEVNQDACTR